MPMYQKQGIPNRIISYQIISNEILSHHTTPHHRYHISKNSFSIYINQIINILALTISRPLLLSFLQILSDLISSLPLPGSRARPGVFFLITHPPTQSISQSRFLLPSYPFNSYVKAQYAPTKTPSLY